jgi:hypothetical protein
VEDIVALLLTDYSDSGDLSKLGSAASIFIAIFAFVKDSIFNQV